MGFPLGPTIANIFMSDLEEQNMKKLEELGIRNWSRFVDDIFTIVKSKEDAYIILEFLNKLHPNIKFTMEMEEKNTLNFLDIKIEKTPKLIFLYLAFHKDTFTGVYLNWRSLLSRKYKISLIKCLLFRIFKICSNEEQK